VAWNWVDGFLYVVALGAEMYKVTLDGAVTPVTASLGLPTDITFDGTDLWVTSIEIMGSNKIHKISTSGGILATHPVTANGEFPQGITYWEGSPFRVLTSSMSPLGTYHVWEWGPGGSFSNPIEHVCADYNVCAPLGMVKMNGEFWHGENGGAIARRTASFGLIDRFSTAGLWDGIPSGVARSGDYLWATTSAPGRLVKLVFVQ
jgi:hypothetical protein